MATPRLYNNYKSSCCFNHVIGLPLKNGIPKPLFDYEQMVVKCLLEPPYNNYKTPALSMIADSIKDKRNYERERSFSTKYVLSKDKIKHVAVLKASGLGITELVLRFMAWLCLRNDDLKGSQMIIFTGPRLELAVSLIQRLKDLFKPLGITFTDKETVLRRKVGYHDEKSRSNIITKVTGYLTQ